jgi:hypothetical protein
MFAALDEGYYLNLRKQSMKNSAKERIYWKKYKGKWKKTATKKEKTSNELEKKYNAIENQKEPTKAEKLAKETNEKTEQLNKETINELDDIKKGKELVPVNVSPLPKHFVSDGKKLYASKLHDGLKKGERRSCNLYEKDTGANWGIIIGIESQGDPNTSLKNRLTSLFNEFKIPYHCLCFKTERRNCS